MTDSIDSGDAPVQEKTWWTDAPFAVKFILVIVLPAWLLISISTCSRTGEAEQTLASAAASPSPTREWLVGNWVMTPKGGEDGKTSCGDFNAPALYKLNGKTAKLVSFGDDGRYQSIFAYTTPSDEEHTQQETASWSLEGNSISRKSVEITIPPVGITDDDTFIVQAENANALKITYNGDSSRFVRCEGNVDDILAIDASDEPSSPEPVAASLADQPDLVSLCSHQETVDGLAQPFRSAVTQVLTNINEYTHIGVDEALMTAIRVAAVRDRVSKPTYKYLNIRNTGIERAEPDTVTVRCQADLRLVEPMEEANGAFSHFLQFNKVRYAIRLKGASTESPQAYFLAEIQPVNGSWDITTGNE